VGSGFTLGQNGGQETVTLSTSQLPAHTHLVQTATGSQGGAKSTPGGNVIADENLPSVINPQPFTYAPYANDANQRTLGSKSIQSAGGSQPHDNMVPFLVVNFIISLFGIFPSQT
jgi:microcystin-dependent protein